MKIIKLEDWQVKNLREYFGNNDKTQTAHWAFPIFDKAHKEAINYTRCCKSDSELLPDVSKNECNCSNAKDRLDCGFECYNK